MPISTMNGMYYYNGRPFKTLQEAKEAELQDQFQMINPAIPASSGIPVSMPNMPSQPQRQPSPQVRNPNGMGGMMPPAPQRPRGLVDFGANKPEPQPEASPSFFDRLTSKQGIGAIGNAMLAMSQDPALQRMGMAGMDRMREAKLAQQERAQLVKAQNRTIKALRDAKRDDLADAVESGLLAPTDAAKILFAKQELPAEIRTAQWYLQNPEAAKQLKDLGVIGGSGVTINTGDQVTPAKAESGTQVIREGDTYTQVPMFGSDAANQVQTAIQTAQNTLDVIDQTMADEEGLAAAVGPLDARTPTFGESATRFESYHNQLKGKAFLAAFESLKGGGQITEIEGQKAEQAISRLNLAMSEKDYKDALQDLRQVVEQGLQRAKDQWGRIPKPESATSSNDPLGIR